MSLNPTNYREYLLLMLDDALSPADRQATEQFLLRSPEAMQEWRSLKATRLTADTAVTFPGKARLYRREEEATAAPVIALPEAKTSATEISERRWPAAYLRWSAAAALLALSLGVGYRYLGTEGPAQGTPVLAHVRTQTTISTKKEVSTPQVKQAQSQRPENTDLSKGINPEKIHTAAALPVESKTVKPSNKAPQHHQAPALQGEKDNLASMKQDNTDLAVQQMPLAALERAESAFNGWVPERATVKGQDDLETALVDLPDNADALSALKHSKLAADEPVANALEHLRKKVSIRREDNNSRASIAISIQTRHISIEKRYRID